MIVLVKSNQMVKNIETKQLKLVKARLLKFFFCRQKAGAFRYLWAITYSLVAQQQHNQSERSVNNSPQDHYTSWILLISVSRLQSSADILVLGPQQTQRITGNALRISFHPDWQINNGFFNRPIRARTQILVQR